METANLRQPGRSMRASARCSQAENPPVDAGRVEEALGTVMTIALTNGGSVARWIHLPQLRNVFGLGGDGLDLFGGSHALRRNWCGLGFGG